MHHMTKVFQNLQEKLAGIQNLPKFSMWVIVHGIRDTQNLEVSKNSEFEDIESLFNITKKLVSENSDIRNVNYMDTTSPSWTRSTLLGGRALKVDEGWKGHVTTVRMEFFFSELLGLDGEPIEFE